MKYSSAPKLDSLICRLIKICILLYVPLSIAMELPVYDFPISAYSQNTNDFIPSTNPNYKKSLLSTEYQKYQLQQFFNHYYASDSEGLSPWSPSLVGAAIPLMKKVELDLLEEFSNQNQPSNKLHYAENFKEHDLFWLDKIKANMDLANLSAIEYKDENRAIAITNTFARALPDVSPDFFHATIPGQGFPFDNLQESALWAGTPLYIFSVTKDKAWSLVLSPDGYFAWVKSSDIALSSPKFIKDWQDAASNKLIAITETEATILSEDQAFLFSGYIGQVFPLLQHDKFETKILIPVKDIHNQALIKKALVKSKSLALMPLKASPQNLAKIINQLKSRPYGWGGAFFFNDCSQEMKSLFTAFGIWLPRNSAKQAKLVSSLDLSKKTEDEKFSLLKQKGHPLMTLVYIGGHIFLYVGVKEGAEKTIMTYQSVWGLSPENHDKRYVIGLSLFFPLLKYYPENPDAASFGKAKFFKLIFLDEANIQTISPQTFAHKFLSLSINHP